MHSAKGKARVNTFTSETRKALISTLRGVNALAKSLLVNHNFSYVLLGNLQTDDLESEFGKYRQLSGGCYFISVEQVMMSARMRKLSLFNKLEIDHLLPHSNDLCCLSEFNEEELALLDNCFDGMESLSEGENATLYYISGYVAKKENFPPKDIDIDGEDWPASEFTDMVSRGKLQHPPSSLFKYSK